MILIALLTVPTALVLTAQAETKVSAIREIKPAKSLHQAAADGDIEQIKSLIATGADVNTKNEKGRTPLHIAAEKGQAQIASLLVNTGADLNAQDNIGQMPLHLAAAWGRKDIVELLISKGANPIAKT